MIITSSLNAYSSRGLQSLRAKISQAEYLRKENWSRAAPFEITPDSLRAAFSASPSYNGEIYDSNGKKTESYHRFKSTKVRALWFVDDISFRPTSSDYNRWDGHVLLDLDSIQPLTADHIFSILRREQPAWVEVVKRSGSGLLHILCKTEVETHQKDEQHFQTAFDTFTMLLNNLLNKNDLKDVVPDNKMRKVCQGMALWKSEFFINDNNNGFNVFETAEYGVAEEKILKTVNEKAINASLTNNIRKINNLSTKNFQFTYDTEKARYKVWQPHGDDHARYKERLAVVYALHSLGASEEETIMICRYGFEKEGLAEVPGYYNSIKCGNIPFMEHNLRTLQDYLKSCGIDYSLRPIIAVDEDIKPLHAIKYDKTVFLKADEHIVGNWITNDEIPAILENTGKNVIYLNAAPGVGKTEMAKWLILKMHKRVCFCCGRNTVIDGKFDGMDVVRCYGEAAENADLEDKKKSLVCSLDWFGRNFEKHVHHKGYDFIVMDEIHLIDEHYRKTTMMKICNIIKKFPSNSENLILMTATPSFETYYLSEKNSCCIKIEKERTYYKSITPIISPNHQTSIDVMIKDVENAVNSGKKVLIVENDTHRNAMLTDYFNHHNIRLVDFNRKNKGNRNVKFVLKNARIPDGYQGLVITSYFGVGNEVFENDDLEVFFMPTTHSHFTSNEIEQYANRIRNRDLNAKIYYNQKSFLGRPFYLQDTKTWNGDELAKQYNEMMLIRDANSNVFDSISPLIQIHKKDILVYELYVFQHAQYELSPSTVLSLLHNEYGWAINDAVYCNNAPASNIQESRKRVNDVNKEKVEKAIRFMYQHYSLERAGEKAPHSPLLMIAKGTKDHFDDKKIVGDDVFSTKLSTSTTFFNEYHRMIAKDIIDFGGWVTLSYMDVLDKKLTLNDLTTILARCRLSHDLGVEVLPFITKCSAYLQNAQLPFNRNTISKENKRTLEAFITSLLPGNPTAIVPRLADYVIRLSKRSDDGYLALDVGNWDNPCDTAMLEVEQFIENKRERILMQKRASKKRCRERKRAQTANNPTMG